MSIQWNASTEQKFRDMIAKVPVFMRGIAEEKVSQRAQRIVREDDRSEITDKDMVDAFFKETPFGFHGPMKSDMDDLGIDYTQYGYER